MVLLRLPKFSKSANLESKRGEVGGCGGTAVVTSEFLFAMQMICLSHFPFPLNYLQGWPKAARSMMAQGLTCVGEKHFMAGCLDKMQCLCTGSTKYFCSFIILKVYKKNPKNITFGKLVNAAIVSHPVKFREINSRNTLDGSLDYDRIVSHQPHQ